MNMRKSKQLEARNAEPTRKSAPPLAGELQLQPVCFDPPHWATRARIEAQWRNVERFLQPRSIH
jgi:hypothetical protein